jgi:FemAB-related protein (PEP-CTERM system-associated)
VSPSPGSAPPAPAIDVEEAGELGSEWDEFVAASPDATCFHQSRWQRAVTSTFGYRSRSLVARRSGRIVGVLPLVEVPTLPWGRSLVSTPQAVYGGPAADGLDSRDALVRRAGELGERLGARYVEFRNLATLPALPEQDLYVTFRRAIFPTEEENMAAILRNQRRSIRIAIKNGLTWESGREDVFETFYDLYSQSVRNLGTPVFPRRLFLNLLHEFGDDCRIFVVRREGRPAAGVMTLFYRDQVLPYYGGARREEFRYAVNDFMYWKLLCHGMEHGYKVFDFGRSKKGSGSYDFKRHWGFEPTPLHYQYRLVRQRSLPDLSPRNRRFSVAIEIWKRTPLWLSRRLGPALVRYFP